MSRLRTVFEMKLPLRTLFEAPTVAQMAPKFERGTGTLVPEAADAIPTVPRDGGLPLSFGQERLWSLFQMAPDDATYVADVLAAWVTRYLPTA